MGDTVRLNVDLVHSRYLVNAEWTNQFVQLLCAKHWGGRGKKEPEGDLGL